MGLPLMPPPSPVPPHQAACSNGVVVVVDRGLAVLTRTWCMFEAFSALYRKGPTSISMTFPGAYRSICVYRVRGGKPCVSVHCTAGAQRVAVQERGEEEGDIYK